MEKIKVSKETYNILVKGIVKAQIFRDFCYTTRQNDSKYTEAKLKLKSLQADLDRFEIKEG